MEKLIYLATVLEGIKTFALIVGVVCLFFGVGVTINNRLAWRNEPEEQVPIRGEIVLLVAIFLIFVGILSPSKQTSYTMIAVHYGEQIINNEKIDNITNDSLDLLDEWITDKKKELKRKSESE